ncbi:MAG: ABC transporter ATP-binding protein [Desulfurococcaceae archaeon]|nr:MAG: ABC transporter ATP-binding protein [Desulfurococcaceae archaeon]
MAILEVKGLSGGYGKLAIVFDASLTVGKNEIVAIVGPNGSGKSTLVKMIAGIATIHRGTVTFMGRDITREPPEKRVILGLGYLPQTNNIFPDMSVEENLEMGGYGLDESTLRSRMEAIFNLFPELKDRKRQRADTLSGGERQMLAISRVLMKDPSLLLLDEPSAGLAPKLVERIFRAVREIRDMGKSVVLVEQHAKRALETSDRGIVMAGGRIVLEGESKQLLSSQDLRLAFFLGKSHEKTSP